MDSSQIEIIEPPIFAATVADEIVASVQDVLAEKSVCTLALAGGSTPGSIYRSLSLPPRVSDIPWSKLKLFMGDERFVPSDDQQSNYRMVGETLLGNLSSETPKIFPVNTELPTAAEAAIAYAELIKQELSAPLGKLPVFDIVLLGLGKDAHFASIFPGNALLTGHLTGGQGKDPICVATKSPEDGSDRISLTPEVIFAARQVFFIVTGAGKAEVVQEVFRSEKDARDLPAVMAAKATTNLRWFIDSAAAKEIRDQL